MDNLIASFDFMKIGAFIWRKFQEIPQGEVWVNEKDFNEIFSIYAADKDYSKVEDHLENEKRR